jgi:TatD DNase family protein
VNGMDRATPRWTDSHCHIQMASGGPDAAIEAARAAGVTALVVVGTDLASSREAVELAARHAGVRATVGLHPHDAQRLDAEWRGLEALARGPGVAAVGETGLDFHYRHSPDEAQEAAFRAQIRLAHELDRTLVVHCREAWDATLQILAEEGPPACTVFHCFTGGPDEARWVLDLGALVSFSGIVSFRGADDVRSAAALVPHEALLIETDAPYLAPVPHRGRENAPAYLPAVGEALAAAAGLALDDLATLTASNAARCFGTP